MSMCYYYEEGVILQEMFVSHANLIGMNEKVSIAKKEWRLWRTIRISAKAKSTITVCYGSVLLRLLFIFIFNCCCCFNLDLFGKSVNLHREFTGGNQMVCLFF